VDDDILQPPEEVLPPEGDPLAARFSGKRAHVRTPLCRAVGAGGPQATYEARLVDISEGGAQVEIVAAEFYGDGSRDGLTLVAEAFPEGLSLRFPEGPTLDAEVVRLLALEEGGMALGCRFLRTLTPAERVLLGVDWARIEAPWLAPPERPTWLLLYGGVRRVAGPSLLARVEGLGPTWLAARLDGGATRAADVAEDLAGRTLEAVLQRDRRVLWRGTLDLLEARAVPDGALDLRLSSPEPFGRSLQKRFLPAVAAL
jgi:hypothetical protein